MSEPHKPKLALHLLEHRLENSRLPRNVRIFIVCSYPRSDMGKGTLVAHMLRILPKSNAIKFDGLLNTNANGRHTARGHDDFGIYEKYNPGRQFGNEHYLLGGRLLKEFIEEYGEYENLTYRPYVSNYFISRIQEMWANIGKPANLIIEIGGTITDFEVDSYVAPALRDMRAIYKKHCQLILVTETGYNNEYIKTKTVRDSIGVFIERTLVPDILVAREPSDLPIVTLESRTEFERTIRIKLHEAFGLAFQKIISIPFYNQRDIDQYGAFLDKYLLPLIAPASASNKILIGSNNPNKVADWISFIGDEFEIVAAADLGLKLSVTEGTTSIKENSLAKAKAWCRISGLPTIADDTGLYINALGGAPGVAVRRWGGALPESATDEDFFNYMKEQVCNLDDTSCYLESVVTVALPNGADFQITYKTAGYLDKKLFSNGYRPGDFPMGLVFKQINRDKVWAEMSDEEKRESDRELVQKTLTLLRKKLY